ncbi:MAG: branched-chain amino acid ABC transporter permease [Spirochaetota bacterium]|nr:branched-chain amino acid ABC transporter permease [Spirochaetota bacterium]
MYSLDVWCQSILIGLTIGGIYALIASGLTLAYSVTNQLHLTHGDFLAIALYFCFILSTSFSIDPYLSFFITAPIFFGLGILVYTFIIKPLLSTGTLLTFQVFLGLVFIIQNALLLIFKSDPRQANSFISMKLVNITDSLTMGLPQLIALIASTLIGLGFYCMLQKTDFGRAVRAVSEDSEAASLMGVNVSRLRMIIFGLAFVLILAAASLIAPWWNVSPQKGLDFTLFALIIVIVGGMGNFAGALISGFTIGVLRSISGLLFGPALALIFPYAILLIILIVRPQGIMKGT